VDTHAEYKQVTVLFADVVTGRHPSVPVSARLSTPTGEPIGQLLRYSDVEDPTALAVRSLYDEHGAALWRYAMRLTGDRARAEDVVQETLLRGWQHPEVTDDGQRSARAWLFTVARNMIIDERRSSRFRNEVSPDDANAALDRMLIGEALAQLSPEHRAVVGRSYYLGWTTTQIADDLGIAEGTVKSRLHYAVRALRLTLQEIGVTR
jgi:RNA polymerase sigma-70 factor (ECF subfamily)